MCTTFWFKNIWNFDPASNDQNGSNMEFGDYYDHGQIQLNLKL